MSSRQLQHSILDVLALDKSSEYDWSQGYLKRLNSATSTLYHASLNKVKLRSDEEPARAHVCAYIACERLTEKGYKDADNKEIRFYTDRIPLEPKHLRSLLAIFKQQIFQLSPVKGISWSPSPKKNNGTQSPVKNGDRFSARDPKELRAELFGTPSRNQGPKLSPTKRMVPTPTITDSVVKNRDQSPGGTTRTTVAVHDSPVLTPRRKLTFEEVTEEDETVQTSSKKLGTPNATKNNVSPSRSIFKSAERLRGSPHRVGQQLESRNLSKALSEAESREKDQDETTKVPQSEEEGGKHDEILESDKTMTSHVKPKVVEMRDSNDNVPLDSEDSSEVIGVEINDPVKSANLTNKGRTTTRGRRRRSTSGETLASSRRKRPRQSGNLLTKRFCKVSPAELIRLCNAFELPRDVAFNVLDQYLINASYVACPWQLVCGLVMNVVFVVFNEKRSRDPRVDYWLLGRMAKLMNCPFEDEILSSIDLVKELIVSETWYRQLQVQYNYFDGSSYKETILTKLGSMLQPKNILVTDEQFNIWKQRIEQDISLRDDNA